MASRLKFFMDAEIVSLLAGGGCPTTGKLLDSNAYGD
jgi:hypothetical protein